MWMIIGAVLAVMLYGIATVILIARDVRRSENEKKNLYKRDVHPGKDKHYKK